MAADENGWDEAIEGRKRHRYLSGRDQDRCSIKVLVAFLKDYPNVSNVFVVRRLAAYINDSDEELTTMTNLAHKYEVLWVERGNDNVRDRREVLRLRAMVKAQEDRLKAQAIELEKGGEVTP